MTARFLIGDSLTVLQTLPDASVDLVLTSPPFLALRSYLPADHPDKAFEMGSEATPGEFLDRLLDLVEESARVLTPHGSLAVELGDTYAGNGGAGGDYNKDGLRDGQAKFRQIRQRQAWRMDDEGNPKHTDRSQESKNAEHVTPLNGGSGWPLDKSLCLIPELFRFALVYGFNPLTGRQTEQWRVRNVVRWVRPNPPVGALADKFRPATSDVVIACKDRKRYFDLDAVRVPFTGHGGVGTGKRKGQNGTQHHDNRPDDMPTRINTHEGAPPLDWWVISPGGFPGAHYAVYPQELCIRPIKAMCPERVCTVCGQPSERVAETTNSVGAAHRIGRSHVNVHSKGDELLSSTDVPDRAERRTLGWTDCGHNSWRAGVVLDPFAGSGTTLAVATGHGRDAIGIDLDERNADLARERVGMWLEIEDCRMKGGSECQPI